MEKQLKAVAESYDRAIDEGRKNGGGDAYTELPKYISSDPDYAAFLAARENAGASDSDSSEVVDFLQPEEGMKFVDLGCCLNLMFGGYDKWPSLYHGVDISEKTIELLEEIVAKRGLKVGALVCASMHETPFDSGYFDIGACIGSLEYFERDFVRQAILEMHRILKPGGRLVLDIPNNAGKMRRIMALMEAHFGRPDTFDMLPEEFEHMIGEYFDIIRREDVDGVAMVCYFLRRK